MSRYKCIIFDCDGVLVDSEAIGTSVFLDLAKTLGVTMTLHEGLTCFKGKSLQACIDIVAELSGKPIPETFENEYRKQSFKAFEKHIKPIEGVPELLKTLTIPFCVASSGPESKIKLNLKHTGLLPYFENCIFSCYTIQKWKPDPGIFLWAAKTMGFEPNECVVIEDSLSGVRAAKAGGFEVFGFTAHDYNNTLENEVTKTFDNMSLLLNMIQS